MDEIQKEVLLVTNANPLSSYFRQPKLYIKLPSQGRFYKEDSLEKSENDYPVYAMTAKDELMFKTPDALMNGQSTVSVIKSCIPAIKNPWQMPSIDLDLALIAIRIATHGEGMEIKATCPNCKHQNDFTLNLINFLDELGQINFDSVIKSGPLTINIRPYSYQEVTKIQLKSLEEQKIMSIVNDETLNDEDKLEQFGHSFNKISELTVDVVTGCIESVQTPDATVTDLNMIKDFIAHSDSEIFNKINERVLHLKELMTLKANGLKCEECEYEWSTVVTMDQSNFFGRGS